MIYFEDVKDSDTDVKLVLMDDDGGMTITIDIYELYKKIYETILMKERNRDERDE